MLCLSFVKCSVTREKNLTGCNPNFPLLVQRRILNASVTDECGVPISRSITILPRLACVTKAGSSTNSEGTASSLIKCHLHNDTKRSFQSVSMQCA